MYLTVSEIAGRLKVKADVIRLWINSKKLPAVNVAGSDDGILPRWRVAEADLETFLATRRTIAVQPVRRTTPEPSDVINFV